MPYCERWDWSRLAKPLSAVLLFPLWWLLLLFAEETLKPPGRTFARAGPTAPAGPVMSVSAASREEMKAGAAIWQDMAAIEAEIDYEWRAFNLLQDPSGNSLEISNPNHGTGQ